MCPELGYPSRRDTQDNAQNQTTLGLLEGCVAVIAVAVVGNAVVGHAIVGGSYVRGSGKSCASNRPCDQV
jgi:hypothetical protein